METLSVVTLVAAVGAALAGAISTWLTTVRHTRDRDSRVMLEDIRLRETELKYASAINAHANQRSVELIRESIRDLDEIERELADSVSPSTRERLRRLRSAQYAQLDMLTGASDFDTVSLRSLDRFLNERRNELSELPKGEGEVGSR